MAKVKINKISMYLFVKTTSEKSIAVADPGEGPRAPPNEAPGAEKKSFLRGPPPPSQGLDDHHPPPPLYEGLDPPLNSTM